MAWIRTALSLIGFSKGTAYPSGANCSPGVEPRSDDEFLVSFVSGAATKRIPATQFCLTHDEARRWVEHEAAKVRVLIEWMNRPPDWTVSWVRGLRPMRAGRCFTVKAPNPRSSTRSPQR